jgi:hypothetical protein
VELDEDGAVARAVGYELWGGALDFPVSAHPKVSLPLLLQASP